MASVEITEKAPSKKKKPAPVAAPGELSAREVDDLRGQLAAVGTLVAVIELDVDGRVITANENFLQALGYELAEIRGKHHRMFVDPEVHASPEYERFWKDLRAGRAQNGEFRRIAKGGREVWIQATYTPICDASGTPFKVVKFAIDVTANKLRNADYEGQIAAIHRAQAVIEFGIDGTIVTANDKFLDVMGYELDEIRGRHHRMFVDAEMRQSEEYRRLWSELAAGHSVSMRTRRVTKSGKEVWIQANYNPILDLAGVPHKVVKYASDVTKEVELEAETLRVKAIVESSPIATMLCDRDLTIRYANPAARQAAQQLGAHLPGGRGDLLGSSLLRFVDDPERERRALADARQLPRQVRAKIGPESLELKMYALFDEHGEYSGPAVALEIVTQREAEAARKFEATSVKLNEASASLSAVSSQVAAGATQTAAQAGRVAAAAEEMKGNVAQVASASEQMSASVREIAANASESAKTARRAKDLASGANTTVQALRTSASEIGQVTKLIATIAQQTNLLALNATIEAARAGQAGKGFAVVANEVKELAKETARATEEIGAKIVAIQSDTSKSVEAIGDIGRVVGEIDGYATSIAAAVEQQSATVREIARNANEVSVSVANVVENIAGVAQAAREAERTAAMTQRAAGQVADVSADLDALFQR